MEKQKPVFEAMENLVKAAVWTRDSEYGIRYSITLSKVYRPKDSESWKYTDSFDEVDVLSIPRVLYKALDFIVEQKDSKRTQKTA